VALFVISLISLLKSRLAGGAVVVLLLVPALTIDVMTGVEHLAAIKDGSLTGERSTVLYEVSDYLVENGIGRVAPMNSKNDLCLLYISDNQVSLSFGVSWPKESLKNPKDKVREQNVGEAFALREGRLPAEVGFSHIIAHPAEENGRYYILAAPEDPRWSFPFMDLRALLHELGRPFRLEHRFSSPGDEFSLDLYYFE
jgi:hypothetical protein